MNEAGEIICFVDDSMTAARNQTMESSEMQSWSALTASTPNLVD